MNWIKERLVLTLSLVVILLAAWIIVTRAPFYLPSYDQNAPPLPEEESYVFGFATLRNPIVRFMVVGRLVPAEPARLGGFSRYRRDLRDTPDMTLEGVRFRVTPAEMKRLDRYEQTGRKYRRDLLPLEDGSLTWVYRLMGETGVEALQD